MQDQTFFRAIRGIHLSGADVVAIIAAVISLLTFTVLLPSGLHLPF